MCAINAQRESPGFVDLILPPTEASLLALMSACSGRRQPSPGESHWDPCPSWTRFMSPVWRNPAAGLKSGQLASFPPFPFCPLACNMLSHACCCRTALSLLTLARPSMLTLVHKPDNPASNCFLSFPSLGSVNAYTYS